jgi:hypothetical protein
LLRVVGFGLSNKACRSVVKVDWDIPYTLVAEDKVLLSWLDTRAKKLGLRCIARPSSSGNTHITCCTEKELTEEERLVYEIMLLDDPVRIKFNLKRLLLSGKLHDRLFSHKEKLLREPL